MILSSEYEVRIPVKVIWNSIFFGSEAEISELSSRQEPITPPASTLASSDGNFMTRDLVLVFSESYQLVLI